jgi:hypothetical protein
MDNIYRFLKPDKKAERGPESNYRIARLCPKKPAALTSIILSLLLIAVFSVFFLAGCNDDAGLIAGGTDKQMSGQAENADDSGTGSNAQQGPDTSAIDSATDNAGSDIGKSGDQGSSQAKDQGLANETSGKDIAGNEAGKTGKTEDTTGSSGELKKDSPEGEEIKIMPAPPLINLHIIIGPEYAQDNQVCFYRVMADISGQPFPVFSFSKDDSNGAWGPNVAQVNLSRDETFTLKCGASNSQGTAAAEITLVWVENPNGQQDNQNGEAPAPEILVDYTDSANFLVDVNLTVQQVTVLYKGVIIKTMPCSGGKSETPTPLGTYATSQKIYYAWIPKFAQGAFYWTRFYGPYLFHSVPYDSNGNMMLEELGKMGSPASHGCVRLLLEDAKWFYETLPLGIKVSIHN